ncbi:MAG: tRNA pseudouridine(38-40) synthase TruA [Dethiosulfovibrio peptidovorans]|nr:MAG: tRNA pseudouridine(38-40) synthase TruA [Dethiosulfovibrio peptidovorans]
MKYAVEISYRGDAFSGWQRQPRHPSVQGELERVLALLDQRPVPVTGAGRTDSGVHARGQVASFSLSREWEPSRLVLALNAHLPQSISIMRAGIVPDEFDARKSALWREYAYFVWHGPSCYPHLKAMVWWRKRDDWDHAAIHRCCRMLEGVHDFSAFCRVSECPDNPVRELLRVRHIRRGRLSILRVRGTAFLTNMIRIMVGNLDAVAQGRKDHRWFEDLLRGESRIRSAMTVPATGLFFWRVGYKDF